MAFIRALLQNCAAADAVLIGAFPKDRYVRNMWVEFCNKNEPWEPKRTSVVCSAHFKASDFQVHATKSRRFVENAIPTLLPDCVCVSHPLPVIYIDSPATPMTLDSPGELSSRQQHILTTVSVEISEDKEETPNPWKRKMQLRIDQQKIACVLYVKCTPFPVGMAPA
ncbi:hypothetical protein evm_012832 [Chilo suppressalis]|nr:hypothetical protein evm_012832 [Chilo suppressalis]